MSPAVYLRRTDPTRNMARFYAVTLQPTLFGEVALVREWGRIGSPGRVKVSSYPSRSHAESALERLKTSKRKRGYICVIA